MPPSIYQMQLVARTIGGVCLDLLLGFLISSALVIVVVAKDKDRLEGIGRSMPA